MAGKEVYSFDMPYNNPHIIIDLPDGMCTVKTFMTSQSQYRSLLLENHN